jgi:hypothetical protein
MADETLASAIPLHKPKKAKTGAERARAYRQRKKDQLVGSAGNSLIPLAGLRVPASQSSQMAQLENPEPPPTVTSQAVTPVTEKRRLLAPLLLRIAALALAVVGITMNGWYGRSLGSSEAAGWLFLAVGVASDLVALVIPSCAASRWQARQRATALVGSMIWVVTFVFAVTAGVGFASVNIADVTLSRASRVTPAVTAAQAALSDAMSARDRECKVFGKFCREREGTVNDRRQALDAAMHSVEKAADPQTDAAIRIVAWATHGALQPTGNDFAMLRLVLLALLPQIGGIFLMVARWPQAPQP